MRAESRTWSARSPRQAAWKACPHARTHASSVIVDMQMAQGSVGSGGGGSSNAWRPVGPDAEPVLFSLRDASSSYGRVFIAPSLNSTRAEVAPTHMAHRTSPVAGASGAPAPPGANASTSMREVYSITLSLRSRRQRFNGTPLKAALLSRVVAYLYGYLAARCLGVSVVALGTCEQRDKTGFPDIDILASPKPSN